MRDELLLKQVRPWAGPVTDIRIQDGAIAEVGPALHPSHADATILQGENQILLPGLVDAHAHVDKNLLGMPWQPNQVPGPTIQHLIDNERRLRREWGLSAQVQSAHQVRAALAMGTTHIRTHVDIDTEAGLAHFEGVCATRDQFKSEMTMQLVAFPQSGMLVRPGTVTLLEEALKLGAECIGGLDPSSMDRDPARHLDIIFELAVRYGVEVDIHLHEPGALGAFAVELIAERTRALGLQGRVTISHVFCLGMVEEDYLQRLLDLLLENRITIMSLGSGRGQFPPLKRLHDAGVRLCTGTDGIRDTWGPYNGVDMLERVKLLGYRSGYRRDEEIEMLLTIATTGGAAVMRDHDYGLTVGKRADLVVVPGDSVTEAVINCAARSFVLKQGQLVAKAGVYCGAHH